MKINIKMNVINLIILLVAFSLFISPIYTNILLWTNLPFINIIRSIIWILYIPFSGVYLTTIINSKFSLLERIVYGYHISIILLCVITLIIYKLSGVIFYVPYIYLLLTIPIILYNNKSNIYIKGDFYLPLCFIIIVNLIICFLIQYCQKYLIPTDLWVVSYPAIEIIKKTDFLNSYKDLSSYPILFGIFLSGITSCTGIPVINTFVLLFFYSIINIITFFLFINSFFNFSKIESSIITLIYGFGGGLGWLLQIIVWDTNYDLNTIRRMANDIFLDMGWWHTMEYSHRALALTFSLVSLLFLNRYLSYLKKKDLFVCCMSIIFVLYIHMVELIMIVPSILYLFYSNSNDNVKHIKYFLFFILFSGIIIDFLTAYNFSLLILVKIMFFIETFKSYQYLLYIIGIFFISYTIIKTNKINILSILSKYKIIVVSLLLIIYLMGEYIPSTPLELSDPFGWNLYVKRYGLIGIFAIFEILLLDWKDKIFKFILSMALGPLIIGSLWWGSRFNAYLYPSLIILCGMLILNIYNNIDKINLTFSVFRYTSKFIKPISLTMIILIITSTSIHTIYIMSTNAQSVSHNYVKVMNWMYENINENDTILVQNNNKIIRSVFNIASANVTYYGQFKEFNYNNKRDFISLLNNNKFKYIFYPMKNETFIKLKIRPFPEFYYENATIIHKQGGVYLYYISKK